MKERLKRMMMLKQMREDATAKAFSDWAFAKEQYDLGKQKYEQLVSYRVDYMQQLEIIGRAGSDSGRLRNRVDFIHQLDNALLQLGNHLSQLASVRSRMETIYKEAKASEDAVNKLIEKLHKSEELRMQKLEQKDLDEYAQKQWYSKNLNDETNRFDN